MRTAAENAIQNAYPLGEQTSWPAESGLTKRELFAAMAMQGHLASPRVSTSFPLSDLADISVNAADALLARLASDPLKRAEAE